LVTNSARVIGSPGHRLLWAKSSIRWPASD
jgi:hypothetical protein